MTLATTEPTNGGNTLAVQMEYARVVSSAALLPDAYRNKPADIMLAVGLGQSMGLSPAESLYRIHVIKGKPTASAELIAANVRKAGHRLRVRGDDQSCTATIMRSDDPEFEFEITRDSAWVRAMGLTNEPNYKKQPGTMLQWRAISAVARLACPEALYGVAYTPDEMGDLPSREPQPQSGLAAALGETITVEQEPTREVVVELEDEPIRTKTRGHLFALFSQKGVVEDEQLSGINHITGKTYTSRADLTEPDALEVIRVLKSRPDADQAAAGGA